MCIRDRDATGYEVFRADPDGQMHLLGAPVEATYSDSSAAVDTTYSYTVVALYGNEMSPESEPLVARRTDRSIDLNLAVNEPLPASILLGDSLLYSFELTNLSTDQAQDVRFIYVLPNNASLSSVSVEGGECTNVEERNIACACLLYTSPSPRDRTRSRMPSSA